MDDSSDNNYSLGNICRCNFSDLNSTDTLPTDNKLTEHQQMLLMQLHDGECSLLKRWIAKRLINSSPDAQLFMKDLLICKEIVQRRSTQIQQFPSISWSVIKGVDSFIDREECVRDSQKSKIVTGSGIKTRSNIISRQFNDDVISKFRWGVFGAISSTAFLLFFMPTLQKDSEIDLTSTYKSKNASNIKSVLYNEGSILQYEPTKYKFQIYELGDTAEQPSYKEFRFDPNKTTNIENPKYGVEWVSSGGTLRFISSTNHRSPVLWISRNSSQNTSSPSNTIKRGRSIDTLPVPTVSFVKNENLNSVIHFNRREIREDQYPLSR